MNSLEIDQCVVHGQEQHRSKAEVYISNVAIFVHERFAVNILGLHRRES